VHAGFQSYRRRLHLQLELLTGVFPHSVRDAIAADRPFSDTDVRT
jgi:hypothetical protein